MQAISFYLEGISITSDEKSICEQFRGVLESIIGEVGSDISYSNGVIKLNTSGVIKSEIFINQKKILSDLNSELKGVKISRIY
jgi:hypothetical protein